jgi:hypothetical protein
MAGDTDIREDVVCRQHLVSLLTGSVHSHKEARSALYKELKLEEHILGAEIWEQPLKRFFSESFIDFLLNKGWYKKIIRLCELLKEDNLEAEKTEVYEIPNIIEYFREQNDKPTAFTPLSEFQHRCESTLKKITNSNESYLPILYLFGLSPSERICDEVVKDKELKSLFINIEDGYQEVKASLNKEGLVEKENEEPFMVQLFFHNFLRVKLSGLVKQEDSGKYARIIRELQFSLIRIIQLDQRPSKDDYAFEKLCVEQALKNSLEFDTVQSPDEKFFFHQYLYQLIIWLRKSNPDLRLRQHYWQYTKDLAKLAISKRQRHLAISYYFHIISQALDDPKIGNIVSDSIDNLVDSYSRKELGHKVYVIAKWAWTYIRRSWSRRVWSNPNRQEFVISLGLRILTFTIIVSFALTKRLPPPQPISSTNSAPSIEARPSNGNSNLVQPSETPSPVSSPTFPICNEPEENCLRVSYGVFVDKGRGGEFPNSIPAKSLSLQMIGSYGERTKARAEAEKINGCVGILEIDIDGKSQKEIIALRDERNEAANKLALDNIEEIQQLYGGKPGDKSYENDHKKQELKRAGDRLQDVVFYWLESIELSKSISEVEQEKKSLKTSVMVESLGNIKTLRDKRVDLYNPLTCNYQSLEQIAQTALDPS